MCKFCGCSLDAEARGLLCSTCWFAYVRAIVGDKGLEQARMALHDETQKIEQLSLFIEGK